MINRRDAIRWTLGTTAAVAIVPASSHASKIGDKNTLETRFSRQFKLKHPFVCAGMAFVCDTSPLAISVALAGGVGCLAGSLLSPSTLAKRIEEIQAATHGLFHVNFLKPFPHQEQLEVCIAKRVPIVSFHWGFPDASTVSRLQASGISVWAQVGSVDAAKEVNDKGANCIVVQGTEAGGHNYGVLPLASSMSLVRAALGDEVLLLGAGGISDGRTAAAAFAAGADGIWVGTRMVATTEANAHDEYKRRLLAAGSQDTVLTHVYGPEKPFDSFAPVPETVGDFDQMPIMCGQGVGLIKKIGPAGDVLATLMNDAALSLRSALD